MINIVRPKFGLGRVVATPSALELLQSNGQSPQVFLDRHVRGDWGEISEGDGDCNEAALNDGSRIMSVYATKLGQKVWVITEAADERGRRPATTILLPDEY